MSVVTDYGSRLPILETIEKIEFSLSRIFFLFFFFNTNFVTIYEERDALAAEFISGRQETDVIELINIITRKYAIPSRKEVDSGNEA